MADEKIKDKSKGKPGGKPTGKSAGKFAAKPAPAKPTHPATPVVILAAVVVVVTPIIIAIRKFFGSEQTLAQFFRKLWLFLSGQGSPGDVVGATGSTFLVTLFFLFKIFTVVASIILIGLILVTARKLAKVNAVLKKDLYPSGTSLAAGVAGIAGAPVHFVNPKWKKVEEHINSESPSDWRLAILEADIMLDEMLDKMGYHAETLGERLKQIEPSDFTTLESAWEAHKIRNLIAHEGSDFLINKREADRVIALFKEVFLEFKYI